MANDRKSFAKCMNMNISQKIVRSIPLMVSAYRHTWKDKKQMSRCPSNSLSNGIEGKLSPLNTQKAIKLLFEAVV